MSIIRVLMSWKTCVTGLSSSQGFAAIMPWLLPNHHVIASSFHRCAAVCLFFVCFLAGIYITAGHNTFYPSLIYNPIHQIGPNRDNQSLHALRRTLALHVAGTFQAQMQNRELKVAEGMRRRSGEKERMRERERETHISKEIKLI